MGSALKMSDKTVHFCFKVHTYYTLLVQKSRAHEPYFVCQGILKKYFYTTWDV